MKSYSLLLMSAALCGGLSPIATAQNSPATPTARTPFSKLLKRMHAVRLKNVPPSLMAWWLDPQHHSQPVLLAPGRPESTRQTTNDPSNGFALPTGIDRIVPIDPQNSLLVFGTNEGAAKLEEIISFLDRPLRQVEIKTQWVQVNHDDVSRLEIKTNPENNGGTPETAQPLEKGLQIGFVRSDYLAILNQLAKENRAKVITAPRVLTFNNVRANVQSFNAAPAVISFQNGASQIAQTLGGTAQIGIENSIAITPTINSDDTITILMFTRSAFKLSAQNGAEMFSKESKSLETIFNVRDGDTIALSGADSRFSAMIPTAETKDAAKTDLLIFVTPRIIRRVDDAEVETLRP